MKFETKVEKGVNIFVISGGFTFHNLGDIREAMKKAVSAAETPKFLVDLSKAKTVDSSGLGTIVSIYKTVLLKKGAFGIIAHEGEIKEVVYTIGLNKLFPIFDNEEQAISSI
ncbi:MAG: STAS domain-containing protein [Nitrospinae bacterium]|nr:STAS domain-containing protein [Nitrospinota bacterium]